MTPTVAWSCPPRHGAEPRSHTAALPSGVQHGALLWSPVYKWPFFLHNCTPGGPPQALHTCLQTCCFMTTPIKPPAQGPQLARLGESSQGRKRTVAPGADNSFLPLFASLKYKKRLHQAQSALGCSLVLGTSQQWPQNVICLFSPAQIGQCSATWTTWLPKITTTPTTTG